MANVRHRVGIQARPGDIFQALVRPDRLTGWWATKATGEAVENGTLDLEFTGLTHLVFRITKRVEDRHLTLTNIDGPDIWIGSELRFDLEQSSAQVYVTLLHEKPEADDDSFLYFNTKWPLFLISLKEFIETGTGKPFPNDVRINHDL